MRPRSVSLLLYPFALEPLFGVRVQLQTWHVAFALLLILLGQLSVNVPGSPRKSRTEPRLSPSRMSRGAAVRVVILSLLPGALLHGVTLSLSTDVASTPFLWVAPLALYLGTYALAFGRRQAFARWRGALSAGPLPAGLILFAVLHGFTDMGLWWGVFHLLLFGLVALWCHGLLWELRPPGEDLTRFYVLIASGGLLGGVLSVLVFPLVFTEVWEYPLLFALAALCLPKPEAPGDGSRPSASHPSARWLACMALSALAASVAVPCLHVNQFPVWLRLGAVLLLALSLPGLWSLRSWPKRMAAALLLISFTPVLSWPLRGGEVIARERTWFGVYRVVDMAAQGEMPGRLRLFFHGNDASRDGLGGGRRRGPKPHRLLRFRGTLRRRDAGTEAQEKQRPAPGRRRPWRGLASLLRAAGRHGQRLGDRPGGGNPGKDALHGARRLRPACGGSHRGRAAAHPGGDTGIIRRALPGRFLVGEYPGAPPDP